MPSKAEIEAAADEGRKREDDRVEDTLDRRGGRVPMGGYMKNLELEFEAEAGFRYRWILDEGERIIRALRGGYQFVRQENDTYTVVKGDQSEMETYIKKTTGRLESGKPQVSYLMGIKEEFYQEDQRAKEAELQETDAAIMGNTLNPHDGKVYHSATMNGRTVTNNPFTR